MKKRILLHSLLVILGCLVFVGPASAAYIDPNTGGLLFQVLAVLFGVLSGIVLIFSSRIKMLVFRIMRIINGSKDQPSTKEDDSEG
jgi:hypothetical protein